MSTSNLFNESDYLYGCDNESDSCERKEPLKIKVKYHADIEKIAPITIGDWIDLRASEDVELKAGEFALIPLGVSMELPKGHEANVLPRSGTFKNFGLLMTNSMGVIDNSYCGNNDIWKMPVLATRAVYIHKNDRICQFRINKTMREDYDEICFIEVDNLDGADRGGFSSTGVK